MIGEQRLDVLSGPMGRIFRVCISVLFPQLRLFAGIGLSILIMTGTEDRGNELEG